MNAFNHIAEWTKNGICRYRLSEKEAKELYRDLPRPQSELDVVQRAQDLAQCLRAALSNQSWNMLQRFKLDPQVDILVIDNWPINSLEMPETPVAGAPEFSDIGLTAAILVGAVSAIGQFPLSYPWENQGRLFRHVTSRLSSLQAKSSHGSLAALPWHTDHATLPIAEVEDSRGCTVAPQTLCLFCMRMALGVPTLFLPVRVLDAKLSAESRTTLRRSIFDFLPPESVGGSGLPALERAPVLMGHGDDTHMRYGRSVTTRDRKGGQALRELRALFEMEKLQVPIQLAPGSLILFKQNKVLHARGGFQPLFDGMDRWLVRLFAAEQEWITPVHPEVPFMGR